MKLRIKRPKSPPPPINSNLVFIIRTQGRLISSNGVFARATDCLFQKLLKVKDNHLSIIYTRMKRTLRTSYSKRDTQE
ncbi:unnamed protein product [Brassica oleracea var. botrytis]|uniref:Uncharacterized protein n=1 Tax=Brassica oleracea TaxID=3712 RepID=A0A3P6GF65_BRAOL|nr:unnamed protein product [Brassica oleracea]